MATDETLPPVPTLDYAPPPRRFSFVESRLERLPFRPRRVFFFIGMWCALGGLGLCLTGDHSGSTFLTWGGILLGLTIPLR